MGTVALTRRGPWSRLHRGQAWGTVGIWECQVRSSSRLKLRDAALEGALQRGAGAASAPPPSVPSASGTSSHALSLLLRPRRGHSGPREAGASGRCSH